MIPLARASAVLAAAALVGGLAGPVLAGDAVTINVEVSVIGPCLTTTTPALDFGQLAFGGGGFQSIQYANCSGVEEHVFGRGTGAAEVGGGTVTWSLDDTGTGCPDLGSNKFRLVTPTLQIVGPTDAELEILGAGADGAVNGLGFYMPCPGSDGLGSTMAFQVIFTATF
jgi:hypothetical protein